MGTLSAHGQRKEDLPRVTSNNGSTGLSVVSAPAPVMQRPDLGHQNGRAPATSSITRVTSQQSVPESQGSANATRSTKSQRIRGASSTLRNDHLTKIVYLRFEQTGDCIE